MFWIAISLMSFFIGLLLGGLLLLEWHDSKMHSFTHTGIMYYAGETYDVTPAERMQGTPHGKGIITSAWYQEDEHD